MRKSIGIFIFLIVILMTGEKSFAQTNINDADMVVALDGSGDFTSIQEAIDAVPSDNDRTTVIYIKRGLYDTEKLIIPGDKVNVTFIGESREETIISYHIYDCDGGKCPADDAALWSGDNIRTSATLTIMGDGFRAENLTIQNTAGPVGQAQAITVRADKVVFINCDLTGYQDTIYLWDSGKRSYFENCLILGRTDYIYGGGIAFFNNCEIRSWGGGWITAPSTPLDQPYGFVFHECNITYADNSPRAGDDGTMIALGRPWHNYPKVAWLNCEITGMLNPLGWPTIWNMDYAPSSEDLHLFEYNNTGPGADMSGRADWAGLRELSAEESLDYTVQMVLGGSDGWDPSAEPPAVTVYEWTGLGATTDWLLAENWNPENTPQAGEAAIIDGDFLATADGGIFEADLSISGGATLEVTSSGSLAFLTTNKAIIATSQDVSLDGKIKTKDTTNLDVSGNMILNTPILGIHKIFKQNEGKLTLAGDNSGFSGEWIIQSGIVEALSDNSLGDASVVVDNGATLVVGNENAFHPQSPLHVVSGSLLELNTTVILSEFYIDGTLQSLGEYNASTHPDLIFGPGKIIVGRPDAFIFIGGDNGNWDNPDHYVPALMPEEGDTVLCELEIETTSTVYPANLFLSNTGRVRLRGSHKSTGNIHMTDGTSLTYNTGGTGMSLDAPIFVDGDIILNMESGDPSGSIMTLSGPISGSHEVAARNNGKGVDNTGTVFLSGDNRNFSGTWDLTKTSTKHPELSLVSEIEGASANAFGTGKIVVGDGNRVILNHIFCVTDSLYLTLEGSGIAILAADVIVKGFYLNGEKQDDGMYSSDTHPFVFEGNGSLLVDSSLKLPSAPSGLSATEILYDQVSIEWTINADNADGHVILLNNNPIDTLDLNTAIITGLTSDTEYNIGVFAQNILGNSDTLSLDITTLVSTVGINLPEEAEFNIFPNPVEDILFIKSKFLRRWEMFDLKGQILKTGTTNSVDLGKFPPGAYVFKIQSVKGSVNFFRVVKK